ncbi:MAG: patatin-like phospholipase family protein [Nitrospirota bacterium]
MKDTLVEQGPIPLTQVLAEEAAELHDLHLSFPDHLSKDERLTHIYDSIHRMTPTRSALCLSGGGIRSATFGLGVLQGLARRNLLNQFDYLSTVSGGGYIGSWLTAWIRRDPQGLNGVCAQLVQQNNTSTPEPEQISWLRNYSSYMSPRLGLLSADSWTLIGTYLRNLILNWLVLLPFFLAVLTVPLLYRATLGAEAGPQLRLAFAAMGIVLLLTNLTYLHLCRPSLWKLRQSNMWTWFESQRLFLFISLLPLLLGVSLLTVAWEWFRQAGYDIHDFSLFGLSSLWTLAIGAAALHTIAWITAALVLRRPWGDGWRILELLTIVTSGLMGGGFLWIALTLLTRHTGIPNYADWYAGAAVPIFLSLFLLAATFFIGGASRLTGDGDREWWGRSGSWVLISIVCWTGAAIIVIVGPWALSQLSTWVASAGGLTSLLTVMIGFSAKTAANPGKEKSGWWTQLGRRCYLLLLVPLTVILILIILARVNTAILDKASWFEVSQYIVGMALFSVLMSFVININKFSLHSMYRNRLIRAYLGASRGKARRTNSFTGFDPGDNLQMTQLAPEGGPIQKPLHVLNIALNLVHGQRLTWQQRKAQSFTVSPLHCGSFVNQLGYRRSSEYGNNPAVDQSITIGTALAISGAAASPNMGYHSSPAVTLLLTLFNVRLGWWLGNPGEAGEHTYTRSCPEFAVGPLLAEAFGFTNEQKRYIYLSDGGHFENLGLYEMVLRRCHCILVVDGGCDEKVEFQDLGNAIRKIRIDLGIDIGINLERLRFQSQTKQSGGHYAIGTIWYSRMDPDAPDGILIYLKPSLSGDEPVDILEYATHHGQFPHEPTTDQFFDESQFESYRQLGEHIAEEVFPAALTTSSPTLSQIFEALRIRSEIPRT